MPHAFLLVGAVPAAAAFITIACLTLYFCLCLAAASVATGQLSYSGVLAAQLGAWAAVALDLAMAITCLGVLLPLAPCSVSRCSLRSLGC